VRKSFSPQSRKKLQKMMLDLFNNETFTLSPQLQSTLVNDMVTALQNLLLSFQKTKKSTSIAKKSFKKPLLQIHK
jgi:hypothetical protein